MGAAPPNPSGARGPGVRPGRDGGTECAILVLGSPDRAREYSSLVKERHLFLRPCLAQDQRRGGREIRGNQHAFAHTDGTTSLGSVPTPQSTDSRVREI